MPTAFGLQIELTFFNRHQCSDLSILIPFRADSIERIENILSVVYYISLNTSYNIYILECAPFCNKILQSLLGKYVAYEFIEDNDPIFHRTHYINQMTMSVKTPFIAVWDADVIIEPAQIHQAVDMLHSKDADFVYPYDKYFLDTTPIIRKLFLENRKIETLKINKTKMKEMYTPNPLGGVFLANVEAYKSVGMENENFYGWGLEDGERYYRWEKFGYKIKRVQGVLYHLSHSRGINSKYHNADQGFWKQKETMMAKRLVRFTHNDFED